MSEPLFKLSQVQGVPVSDAELIADLRRVAETLAGGAVTQALYEVRGRYSRSTPERRFGSWNAALLKAGLALSNRMNISDEELFENVLALWQHFGRQPRRRELAFPPSSVSEGPYKRRFGSWMNALRVFVDYANGGGTELTGAKADVVIQGSHKTPRDPSLRIRWRVLRRDNFKCCKCGRSPAITPGIELHVDHVYPWSLGGETVLENLQTLCFDCNLGKSNLLPA